MNTEEVKVPVLVILPADYDFAALLARSYVSCSAETEPCPVGSRLEFIGDHILDFTTYDSVMSERFARKVLGACLAITDFTTFEFIEDDDQHFDLLMVANLPPYSECLNWGSSVRGAWWEITPEHPLVLSSFYFEDEKGNQMHPVGFDSVEAWDAFVHAMVAFVKLDEVEDSGESDESPIR